MEILPCENIFKIRIFFCQKIEHLLHGTKNLIWPFYGMARKGRGEWGEGGG